MELWLPVVILHPVLQTSIAGELSEDACRTELDGGKKPSMTTKKKAPRLECLEAAELSIYSGRYFGY